MLGFGLGIAFDCPDGRLALGSPAGGRASSNRDSGGATRSCRIACSAGSGSSSGTPAISR